MWFLVAYTARPRIIGKALRSRRDPARVSISILVWSCAAMVHAFAWGLGSLSCFRFLLGLGEAGNWPGAAKVITEWFPVRGALSDGHLQQRRFHRLYRGKFP